MNVAQCKLLCVDYKCQADRALNQKPLQRVLLFGFSFGLMWMSLTASFCTDHLCTARKERACFCDRFLNNQGKCNRSGFFFRSALCSAEPGRVVQNSYENKIRQAKRRYIEVASYCLLFTKELLGFRRGTCNVVMMCDQARLDQKKLELTCVTHCVRYRRFGLTLTLLKSPKPQMHMCLLLLCCFKAHAQLCRMWQDTFCSPRIEKDLLHAMGHRSLGPECGLV